MVYYPSGARWIRSGTSKAFSGSPVHAVGWFRAESFSQTYQTVIEFNRSGADSYNCQFQNNDLGCGDGAAGGITVNNLLADTWYAFWCYDTGTSGGGSYAYVHLAGVASWSGGKGGSAWGHSGNFDINYGGSTMWTGDDFYGEVVAVKVWNEALTSDEAMNESKQIAPIRTTDLIAFSPMLNTSDMLVNFQDSAASGFSETGSGTISDGDKPPIPWRQGVARDVQHIVAAAPSIDHLDLDRGFRRGQPSGLLRGVA